MNESDWLKCSDPTPMLEYLRGKVSERKIRLFAVACCRRIWHLLTDERSRNAVEVAEQFADGTVHPADLFDAHLLAGAVVELHRETVPPLEWPHDYVNWLDARADASAAAMAAERTSARFPIGISQAEHEAAMLPPSQYQQGADTAHSYAIRAVVHSNAPRQAGVSGRRGTPERTAATNSEASAQARLIDEIFGNPFCPVALDPTWLSSTVLALAQGIYDEIAFDRMPILADALQDAGCEQDTILNHLRGDGPHTKGCWAVDLLTGRE